MFFRYKPTVSSDGKKYIAKIHDGTQYKNVIPYIYIEPTDLEVLVNSAYNDFYDTSSNQVYVYPYGQLKSIDEIEWYYDNSETYPQKYSYTSNGSSDNLVIIQGSYYYKIADLPIDEDQLTSLTSNNFEITITHYSGTTYPGYNIQYSTYSNYSGSGFLSCTPTESTTNTTYFYIFFVNSTYADSLGIEPGIYFRNLSAGYISKLIISI